MENRQTQTETSATGSGAGAAKQKDRSTLILGGIVGLLVVAAIVVVVLVVNQSQATQQASVSFANLNSNAEGPNGQLGATSVPNVGQGGGQFNGQFGGPNGRNFIQQTPAPELPTASADLIGVVTQINGQSLMVNQNFNRAFRPGATPDAALAAGTPLPPIEVIVASATLIYQDTTPRPNFQNGQPPSEPIVLQQQVTLSSLSALPANSRVTVWGTRSGNQIKATLIVFSEGFQRFQPPGGGNPGG